MEPALAAVGGATRVLLRQATRVANKLPELVRGTTLDDLKNAKRRAEQGLDIVTGGNKSETRWHSVRWSRDFPWESKTGHQSAMEEVGNGTTVQRLIAALGARERMPDFILCIGDHGSDEDRFKAISAPSSESTLPEAAETFACKMDEYIMLPWL